MDLVAVTYTGGFDEVRLVNATTGENRTVAKDETIQVLPATADGLSDEDWSKKKAPTKKPTVKKDDD